jgi:hypothetical protein
LILMLDTLRGDDEALKILLFVCLPLLILLIAWIVRAVHRGNPTATFPDFSIAISPVGPDTAYLQYRQGDKFVDFPAEFVKGKKFASRISVRITEKMPDAELRKLVRNMAKGLRKLRYDYVVYRTERHAVLEEEQQAAIEDLRRMGFDRDNANPKVFRLARPNFPTGSPDTVNQFMAKVPALMAKANGFKEEAEILADSESFQF